MFSLLIPYLAPFFGIFHPRHQITGGNITYIHSTHTPLARRDHRAAFHSSCTSISTHTSLARRNLNFDHMYRHDRNFYSHAPCGARRFTRACLDVISRFLLTRPCGARRDRSAATNTGDRFLLTRPMRGATATYSIRIYRTSYIQEADSKIITKYAIKLNMLHDSGITSRRTSLDYTHHSTFAYYAH